MKQRVMKILAKTTMGSKANANFFANLSVSERVQ